MSMQHSFEEFSEKQRRFELKSVGNFEAKTVLVESANHMYYKTYLNMTFHLFSTHWTDSSF